MLGECLKALVTDRSDMTPAERESLELDTEAFCAVFSEMVVRVIATLTKK